MENIYGEQAPDGLTSKRILSFTRIDILVGGLEPWIFMTFHSVGKFGTMDFYDFPFSWECYHPS